MSGGKYPRGKCPGGKCRGEMSGGEMSGYPRNTCKITGQKRVMFNKIVNINHIVTKFATIVPYT